MRQSCRVGDAKVAVAVHVACFPLRELIAAHGLKRGRGLGAARGRSGARRRWQRRSRRQQLGAAMCRSDVFFDDALNGQRRPGCIVLPLSLSCWPGASAPERRRLRGGLGYCGGGDTVGQAPIPGLRLGSGAASHPQPLRGAEQRRRLRPLGRRRLGDAGGRHSVRRGPFLRGAVAGCGPGGTEDEVEDEGEAAAGEGDAALPAPRLELAAERSLGLGLGRFRAPERLHLEVRPRAPGSRQPRLCSFR
mmetsp:Transcript_94568/g.273413  ORF Transcript_94568/g.273413 Transcript_94568/m.273413 type:complete len:248 (+) Transcript_94568:812-1555(+)